MCRFGKTNSKGVPIQKKLGFLITDGLIGAFEDAGCICPPNTRAKVEGSETRMSMAYPDPFVDRLLAHIQSGKAARECMFGCLDTEHGICENHSVCAATFVDICREESA